MPRLATVRAIIPSGCRFEIANEIEAFRVENLGGEEEFLRLVLNELRAGDVFYDIGSCLGLFSVHAALKGARVVAFEPDPDIRVRLEHNLRLNGLKAVQVVPWAVSDRRGQATLFTDGADGYSPSLCKAWDRGSRTVPVDTIDAALARGELPSPTVVKMDVEGAECLALVGMGGLLSSAAAPRKFFLEIHPRFLCHFGSSAEDLMETMRSSGYGCIAEAESHDQVHAVFSLRR